MAKRKGERVYPAKEQGIEKDKTFDEVEAEMDIGEIEKDVYSEEGREKLTDEDELSAQEEAFMEGEEKEELGACAGCGRAIGEKGVVEKEIKGERYWFCSDKCAKRFRPK